MKFLVIINILLFISFTAYSEEKESEPKYHIHSLVQQTKDAEVETAIDIWIDFLYEENDSIRRNYWNKEEIQRLGDDYCLFQGSLFHGFGREQFLNDVKPYILSAEKINNDILIKTMFTWLPMKVYDSTYFNQSPFSIVNILAEKNQGKYYLKNYINKETLGWENYEFENLNYIIEPGVEIDTASARKARHFIDSLSILWKGEKYSDTIDYYITSSSSAANRLVGFEFAFGGGIGYGYALTEANMLIIGNGNFNYKHELAHIIIDSTGSKLISEGIASYFGGSANINYSDIKNEFSKQNYPLNEEKIKQMSKFQGFRDYYVLGALVCELVDNKKGIKGLKQIYDTPSGSSGYEHYELLKNKVKQLLNINDSEFLELLNGVME